ncbi:MAG TPA: DEDD exonuclease domain-containing protein [Acidimicrobiia bacterium]
MVTIDRVTIDRVTVESAPLPGFATAPARVGRARQASLDDLGTPLSQVTFVVLDLETTGGSPSECAITEVGAVKMRGGECLGRFETLVNPGAPIPPLITVLTGITEAMLLPAPRIEEVLPPLLEFIGDAVIVGHNVRFDLAFLAAAMVATDRPPLTNRHVDTLAMARRLVRDELPNLKLSTLARHFRVPTEPAHRAYADAQATAEVLHALLERAASFGVLGLDDLLLLPSMRAHPSAAKLALTAGLPRAPGVYLFRDRTGRVLYVGKATNLRSRVRSYFSTDDRRKVPQLLRETTSIDHLVCRGPFEAAVREIRLIQALQPRFNRQAKVWRKYAYLKLTNERFPRLAVTRVAKADGATYVGPLPSAAVAHLVREAIETAVPIRRCPRKLSRTFRPDEGAPCVPAQLGVATCPCRGHIDDDRYAELAEQVRRGLRSQPTLLLDPLEARMRHLASVERFEEAAATRERLATLSRAIARMRMVEQVRAARWLVVDGPEGRLDLHHGRLVLTDGPGADAGLLAPPDAELPPERDTIDELLVTARHLGKTATSLRLQRAAGTYASALPVVPSYEMTRSRERAPLPLPSGR